MWQFYGLTDVGRKRRRNEDSFLIDAERTLCAVADGMGGHANGNIASRMAVDVLHGWFREHTGTADEESRTRLLHEAISRANADIFERNKGVFTLEGMGTTLVVLITIGERIITACVGDSRIYRLRAGKLEQLTQDHSLMEELLRNRIITEESILFSPTRNIITRALGMNQQVEIDLEVHDTLPGDLYLLCSDGLTDMVKNDAIAGSLVEYRDQPVRAIARLIELANSSGGDDNITAVFAVRS